MRQVILTEAELRSLLGRHASCRGAAHEAGVSERTLRDKCAAFGLTSPRTLLGRSTPTGAPVPATMHADSDGTAMTTIVIPDMHVDYHDRVVWNTILKVASVLRPHNAVIIGDFADCYSVSFHPKTPGRRASFEDEVLAVNRELDRLDDICLQRVVYCEGNHEFRLQRYLAGVAPSLYGLMTVPDLFRIEQRGWEWVPYRKWIKIGKIAYSHEVGESGKYSAARTLDAFGNNIVFGHSHRGGVAYGGTVDGDKHVALNVGWGGDADAVDYMHSAKTRDWQHGFGWVEQDASGSGWCSFIPIINGKCVVRGQVFSGA